MRRTTKKSAIQQQKKTEAKVWTESEPDVRTYQRTEFANKEKNFTGTNRFATFRDPHRERTWIPETDASDDDSGSIRAVL